MMKLSLWTAMYLCRQAFSAQNHEGSADNSAISFSSGSYVFRGSRDDDTALRPPGHGLSSEYAALYGKMQSYFSRFDRRISRGQKYILYDKSKTAISISSRGPQWTFGEVWGGLDVLLGHLSTESHPVSVDVTFNRKLMTFATSFLVWTRFSFGLYPQPEAIAEAVAGWRYVHEAVDRSDLQSAIRQAELEARAQGDARIPDGQQGQSRSGQVICGYTVNAPAGTSFTYKELADTYSKIEEYVQGTAFTAVIARPNPAHPTGTWLPLTAIQCGENIMLNRPDNEYDRLDLTDFAVENATWPNGNGTSVFAR